MKPVKTSRVILRQFREGDEEQIYQYASVEGVGERAGWKHHANVQESQSVLYNVFLKNPNCFAICFISVREKKRITVSIGNIMRFFSILAGKRTKKPFP